MHPAMTVALFYFGMALVTTYGIWGLNIFHTFLEHAMDGRPMTAHSIEKSSPYYTVDTQFAAIMFLFVFWPLGLVIAGTYLGITSLYMIVRLTVRKMGSIFPWFTKEKLANLMNAFITPKAE